MRKGGDQRAVDIGKGLVGQIGIENHSIRGPAACVVAQVDDEIGYLFPLDGGKSRIDKSVEIFAIVFQPIDIERGYRQETGRVSQVSVR